MKKYTHHGFTLVEIMIVVVIVGILAAASIPNLLRSRVNANDSVIKSDLRTFSLAMENYRSSRNPPLYPGSIKILPTIDPPYLNSSWVDSDRRFGHTIAFEVASDLTTYTLEALFIPGESNTTFCVDHTSVIRVGTAQPSGAGCNGNAIAS